MMRDVVTALWGVCLILVVLTAVADFPLRVALAVFALTIMVHAVTLAGRRLAAFTAREYNHLHPPEGDD